MPTIATTSYPAEAYVQVDVDWSDQPGVEYARVWRTVTATGVEELLRPYIAFNSRGDLLLNCATGTWWDTEPPLDTAVTYRTEAFDVATNKATNSSFESGTAPWTVAGGTLAASGAFFHAGANSGLLTPNGTTFAPTVTQAAIPITPGKPVVFSGWALTPQGWNAVRLTLRWFSGATQLGATVTTPIEILDDGEWRYLQLDATPPAGATTVTAAFEASGTPPGTTLFYLDQLEVGQFEPNTATITSAPVTITPGFDFYLKDPANPCLDVQLTVCMPGPQSCSTTPGRMVQSYGPAEGYQPNTARLRPDNRPRPIPVSRPRADAEANLSIITRTFADRDALKALLATGRVLFFQAADPAFGVSDRYIDCGVETITRALADHRIQPRFFSIPHEVVDRIHDPMTGPCGIRVDDLCDIYSSWASITLAGLTYADLLAGAASFSSPGVDTSAWRTYDGVLAEFADFNDVNDGVRTFTGLLTGL